MQKENNVNTISIEDLEMLLDSSIAVFDSLSFTKEILINYKVVKDDEDDLSLPDMSRYLSTPFDKKKIALKIKTAKPSIQLTLS